MVYNIKMGIAAGAGIAGTAISTFSSKMGNGQNPSGNDTNKKYGTNNGCSGSSSFGYTGSGGSKNGNGSSSKNDDTFKQMHMWKY